MPEENKDKWQHRRRITYLHVVFVIAMLSAYVYEPERFKETESLFMAVLAYCASVIGAYLGLATYDDTNERSQR